MEEQSGRKRKISELHHNIKSKLAFDYLDHCGPKARRFCHEARQYLESESDKAEDDPLKMMDILEARGHIAPGEYDKLMKIVKPIDNRIVNDIKETTDEIRKITTEDEKLTEIYSLSDVARNIYRTTDLEILEHQRDKAFVSLPFVSQGKAILDRFGILVIVGKSGSGKTKCALEILSSQKKSGADLIFKLPSLNYWYMVVNPNKMIHILFDDCFEKRVDKTLGFDKSSFETMMSTVKYGTVKVILTMNDKSHENYKTDFKTIFRNEMILHIQMETLSPGSKSDILKSHLANNELCISTDEEFLKQKYDCPQEVRNKYISESEVDAILRSNPDLGYPLCCYLFSSDEKNFRQGRAFFENPSNKLIDAIDGLRLSTDKFNVHQFCVLVYAALKDGKVNLEEIDNDLLLSISERVDEEINQKQEAFIRRGMSLLERSYFLKTKEPELYHSSITKATLVSYSKISSDAMIQVLETIDPFSFCEIVRSVGRESEQIRYHIAVPHSLYAYAVKVIRDRIQQQEPSILNTILLDKKEFVTQFLEGLPETLVMDTFTHSCKYNKILVVEQMQQIEEIEILVSQDILTKGFAMACCCGNREIIESLIGKTVLTPKAILEILYQVRYNTDLAILLMQKMQLYSYEQETLQHLSRILVRDECHEVLRFLHQHFVCPEDIIQYQVNLAGRRRSLLIVKWFIETFPFKKNDLVIEALKGACVGGSISVLKYLYEHFREEISSTSNDALRLACESGNPAIVEELLNCDKEFSKLEIGENLRMACFKGFCQVVRVLLINTTCLCTTDVIDGISFALKGNKNGALVVLQEVYDISDNIIKELREEVNKNINTGPLSSMPFTPAPYGNIPSIKISTPCIYQQKHRDQTPKRVMKKVLSREQLSQQMEKYKRCKNIGLLSNDDYNAAQIQRLLQRRPELPYELLKETIHKVVSEGYGAILNVFLDNYDKHNIRESILKELIFEESGNPSIVQCIHHRFDRDMMQYISFARNESIPLKKLFTCLSRNRCLFSPVEIVKATEEMTKQGDRDCIKILLSFLDKITESFSVHKMFLDACRDGTLCIIQTLLGGKYITDSLIIDAFDQCCVYEEVETMKLLIGKRRDLFQGEVIFKAIEKCCKGKYLSSLYFLFGYSDFHFKSENCRNLYLSLLMQTKDECVLRLLLSYCKSRFNGLGQFPYYPSDFTYLSKRRDFGHILKFLRELLLRASSENPLILRCFDDDTFYYVSSAIKVKVLKILLKNRQFEGINLWYLCPDTKTQISRYFSVLLSDELIGKAFLGVSTDIPYGTVDRAILYLIEHKEKEKLSELLTRNIGIIHMFCPEFMSEEGKKFVYECLPPLSQEIEQRLIECLDGAQFESLKKFLFLAEHYEFSTETIDRVHANFCLTQEIGSLEQFWEKINPGLNEECLNSACCNRNIRALSHLINRDNFPQSLVKLTEYILYYILRATIEYCDPTIRQTLVNIIYKSKNGATDLTEPLCNSYDLLQVWIELTGLFCDDITNEIIIKVAKLCCEHSHRETFKMLLFFSEMSVLSKSDVLDCCKMIVNVGRNLCDGLHTCAGLLKNLPLSHCLEFARVVINTKNTKCHKAFTFKYLQECGYYNVFGKVCKRWNDLDRCHPYYRKRALSLIDEFANI